MKSYILSLLALTAPAFGQQIQRVSVGQGGVEADAPSGHASISGDARCVAFQSDATNLVPGDTNGVTDVFVRDRILGTTERVSVGSQGQQGNGESLEPSISGRGRYVAFASTASNFTPGDTPGTRDVFLHDRRTGFTKCASLDMAGAPGAGYASSPSVSMDGRFVAFTSGAHLVPGEYWSQQVYVRDMWAGTTELASVNASGAPEQYPSHYSSISANGRYVVFVTNSGGNARTNVRDRAAQTTTFVSASDTSYRSSISYDGRYVAYTTGYCSTYLHDLLLGTTTPVDQGSCSGGNSSPSVSPNGRYVSYIDRVSFGSTLHIFRWDRLTGETRIVSASASGVPGNGTSSSLSGVSMLGRVVFESQASNLVPGDTNDVTDVFLKAP